MASSDNNKIMSPASLVMPIKSWLQLDELDAIIQLTTRKSIEQSDTVAALHLARWMNPKAEDVMASRKSDPAESVFEIPQADGVPLKITGFSSFVTTRTSAYCFLPMHHRPEVHCLVGLAKTSAKGVPVAASS
jgi:hypothetical protein